jgi:hypothetical protein
MARRNIAAVICFVSCCLTGCGGGLPVVPVSGKVSFNNGPCPAAGSVAFSPVRGSGIDGVPEHVGNATFAPDGRFVVSSFTKGDGLLPGKYAVKISCVTGAPAYGQSYDDVDAVPQDFKPPELVVEKGSSAIDVNYDVPAKKKVRH